MCQSAPSPLPSTHIDHIEQRIAQLLGTIGLLRDSLSVRFEPGREPDLSPDALGDFLWLLDELLRDIHTAALALWRQTLGQEVN